MSYIVQYSVAADRLHQLEVFRPQHRDYVAGFDGQIQFTGLLLAEDETLSGALFVLRVTDRSEAEQFSNGDPYVQAGIFQHTRISQFVKRRGWNE